MQEVLTMREILFRGKRQYTGEWAESVCPLGVMHAGHLCDDFDPSTVGQYTGLTDKNGKRIFEGDICLCDRNIAPSVDAQTFQILFDVDAGQWVGSGPNSDIDASQFFMCEVIENVRDNPELLEGGTDNA